jgi:hypothetical protein
LNLSEPVLTSKFRHLERWAAAGAIYQGLINKYADSDELFKALLALRGAKGNFDDCFEAWRSAAADSLCDLLRTEGRRHWKSCSTAIVEMSDGVITHTGIKSSDQSPIISVPFEGNFSSREFLHAYADAGQRTTEELLSMNPKPVSAMVIFAACFANGEPVAVAGFRFALGEDVEELASDFDTA